MSSYILTGLICLIVGWTIGWVIAHKVIATECERLGGFYVDSKTYKCIEVKNETR